MKKLLIGISLAVGFIGITTSSALAMWFFGGQENNTTVKKEKHPKDHKGKKKQSEQGFIPLIPLEESQSSKSSILDFEILGYGNSKCIVRYKGKLYYTSPKFCREARLKQIKLLYKKLEERNLK